MPRDRQTRAGQSPPQDEDPAPVQNVQDGGDEMLREVLKLSQEQAKNDESLRQKEEEDMQRAINESLQSLPASNTSAEAEAKTDDEFDDMISDTAPLRSRLEDSSVVEIETSQQNNQASDSVVILPESSGQVGQTSPFINTK
jgi:hypothetical protein